MPFAANVFTSTLRSSNFVVRRFTSMQGTELGHIAVGRICGDSNRTTASAMREIKSVATGNVERFSKLPNLRVLEVLGASQPGKSKNSAACVPMTFAVAEFKGPEVHGVVRFAQAIDAQRECAIEVVIDGLAPGVHGWSVHEFGDLTQGPWSTGPAYAFPMGFPSSIAPMQEEESLKEVQVGNLGSLWVDREGHVQSIGSHDMVTVADIIGRSVVVYGHGDGTGDDNSLTIVAAAVIARSARASSLVPRLCNCDGSLLWQGNANV